MCFVCADEDSLTSSGKTAELVAAWCSFWSIKLATIKPPTIKPLGNIHRPLTLTSQTVT